MKRLIFAIMLLASIAIPAAAQTPTVTTPQSVTNANFFNGVSAAQTSSSFTNLGQTVHFLFYQGTSGGNTNGVQIRLEGSFDGVSYVPISDDGIDPGPNNSNVVLAIGAYPFVRANLLKISSGALSASYFGTSSMPGNPFGIYGAGQQTRKIAFLNQATGTLVTSSRFATPYGSTAGYLVLSASSNFTGGAISVRCEDFGTNPVLNFTLPASALFAIPVPATACGSVDVRCPASCTNAGGTFSAFYFFLPPGSAIPSGAQPPTTANTEATAAANTAVVTTLTVSAWERAHVFLVNARCSAGTAQLTVADGASTIFSSAATEVGTTSFTKSWPVGLASSPSNNLVITLGTCGVANTGTLDVEGSVF